MRLQDVYKRQAYNQAKVVLEYLFSEGYGKIFFYDYTHAVKKKEITFDSLDEKKVEVVLSLIHI